MTIKTWRALALLLLLAAPAAAQSKDNPLPPLPQGHSPVSMGYYFIDGQFGDHFDEVACYTDTYFSTRSNYTSDDPNWQAKFGQSLARARAEGMKITLGLSFTRCIPEDPCHPDEDQQAACDKGGLDEQLDLAAPTWDAVERIDLADEPDWTKAQINRRVGDVLTALSAHGLSPRPIGLTVQMDQVGEKLGASELDYVGISAFLPAPGGTSDANRWALETQFADALTKTGSKDIVLVVQAYDRNGRWTNLATLFDLQAASYGLLAADDTDRIKELRFFNYAVSAPCFGGTLFHPELKVPHRWIAERIYGVTLPDSCAPFGTTVPCDSTAPPSLPASTQRVSRTPCVSPPATPAAPSNLSAVGTGFTIELSWRDNSSNETGFQVQRQNSDGNWPTVCRAAANTPTCSDGVAPISSGSATYYYRVVAANGTALSDPSNTATVTLYAQAPTGVPTTIGPNGCISTVRPTFSWNSVARASHYYLTVTQDAVEDFIIDNPDFPGTSYTAPFDLDFGVPHRWKVKACNNQGCAQFSPSVYFTPFCAPTQAPILFEPKGCIDSTQPTLTWSSVAGATGYQVALFQVTDITNDPLVEYTEIPGTSFVPSAPLLAHKEYRFRVKAKAGPSSGPYSRHRFFTVQCKSGTRPGTAGPIAPWDAPIPAPGPVAFAWEVGANAETYRLKVTNSRGNAVFDQTLAASTVCGTEECTFTPSFSFQSGTYTWQLRTGSSTRGNGIWGPGVTFTVP
jgi:hypothetical protein